MKRLFAILLTTLIFLVINQPGAYAQYKENAVKLNIFGLLVGQYQLGFEHAFSEQLSGQLSAGLISRTGSQNLGGNSYESTTSGFILIPEVRYYFGADGALKGAYGAGFIRYRNSTQDVDDQSGSSPDVSREESISTIGGGITLGYQFLLSDAVVIDLFVGPQYKARSSEKTYDDPSVTDDDFNSKFLDFNVPDKEGIGIRFGVNLGVAF